MKRLTFSQPMSLSITMSSTMKFLITSQQLGYQPPIEPKPQKSLVQLRLLIMNQIFKSLVLIPYMTLRRLSRIFLQAAIAKRAWERIPKTKILMRVRTPERGISQIWRNIEKISLNVVTILNPTMRTECARTVTTRKAAQRKLTCVLTLRGLCTRRAFARTATWVRTTELRE